MGRLLAFSGEHPSSDQPDQKDKNINFEWGVKIPLRDGVQLNATLYQPKDPEPTPAIFTLTPYIADSYHERALYFARHAYAFALVDCRGRGNSEGEFEPFINESHDGHDIVEWLAVHQGEGIPLPGEIQCPRVVRIGDIRSQGENNRRWLGAFRPVKRGIQPHAVAHRDFKPPFEIDILFNLFSLFGSGMLI